MKKYLDSIGLAYLWDKIKAYIGSIKYAGSSSVGGAANKTASIPYGQVDGTSTSTTFTATISGITSLEDGTCVLLKNGVVTSESGFTININNLGAKPVYNNLAAATRDSTIFNINYTMLLVYDTTRVSGGCWICYRGYDSNTNYYDRITWGNVELVAGAASGRYSIGFIATDGKFYGFARTSSTSTAKVLNTGIEFDASRILYQLTGTYAAGDSIAKGACYSRHQGMDMRYSCNQDKWATAQKPVYLILHPQSSGYFTIGATIFTQTIPTTNDGLCYMPIGIAYSSYQMVFEPENIIYYHDGTALRIWSNIDLSGKQDVISDLNTIRSGAALGATALQSYTESDPIFAASAANNITTIDISNWNSKSTVTASVVDEILTITIN